MLTAEAFLSEIERFLKRSKMSPSAFGRQAVGDPNFVGDLRDGRMPNLRLVAKVNEFLERERAARKKQRQGAEAMRVAS